MPGFGISALDRRRHLRRRACGAPGRTSDCWIIAPGGSAAFLAVLPIGVLENAELVTLLRRLGIRSLGDFASLAARDVLTRFGREGALLHRLARGLDKQPVVSRQPPLDMNQRVSFTPALETVEPIVFSARQTAERLVAELAYHGLVCTQVRIEVVTEGGWTGSRVWAHSRWFAASDLIDRIYWQLQGDPAPEPVCELRLLPESVESLADHGEGLWGSALNEHVERGSPDCRACSALRRYWLLRCKGDAVRETANCSAHGASDGQHSAIQGCRGQGPSTACPGPSLPHPDAVGCTERGSQAGERHQPRADDRCTRVCQHRR